MENILIFVGILTVLIIAANLFSVKTKDQRQVGSTCRSCPDYRYCGGGRPRCVRRSKTL